MAHARPINLLLRAILATDETNRLSAHLVSVELESGAVIYRPEDDIGPIWFPETGLISISSIMLSGDVVETSLVGQEGGVGLLESCAEGVMFSQARVQAAGVFFRLPASAYCKARSASARLRATVQEHFKLLVTEYRQTVACHARHRVENRLAWWLLEAQDRLGGQQALPLTQDVLADILGVQRTTITPIALKLQKASLIRYRRGVIEILNRPGLESAACECYATTQQFRQRFKDQHVGV